MQTETDTQPGEFKKTPCGSLEEHFPIVLSTVERETHNQSVIECQTCGARWKRFEYPD